MMLFVTRLFASLRCNRCTERFVLADAQHASFSNLGNDSGLVEAFRALRSRCMTTLRTDGKYSATRLSGVATPESSAQLAEPITETETRLCSITGFDPAVARGPAIRHEKGRARRCECPRTFAGHRHVSRVARTSGERLRVQRNASAARLTRPNGALVTRSGASRVVPSTNLDRVRRFRARARHAAARV